MEAAAGRGAQVGTLRHGGREARPRRRRGGRPPSDPGCLDPGKADRSTLHPGKVSGVD